MSSTCPKTGRPCEPTTDRRPYQRPERVGDLLAQQRAIEAGYRNRLAVVCLHCRREIQ